MNTAKDIARWTALGALFLVTLTPLIVINSFFFPFISGKAFYFRILVEVAVCAWGVLALMDKAYRPRFSYIGAVVVAFVAWMLVADAFAINVLKAFWSNYERMEGWMLLIHLLGFFLAASCVLRVEKQWRNWFLASLAVSVILVLHGLLQLAGASAIHQGANRIDASFGNSAYFAIYLLFNTFLAAWLALTESRAWLKWSLLALAVVEAVLIFETQTRGTILGLVGGLAFAGLLAAVMEGGVVRRYALGSLAGILLLIGGFLLIKDTSFVRSSSVLDRLASITLKDATTRFTLWHMAYEGFLARPVTGYGQEGFNYVFDRYYDPSLYAQEPWFDRAHNAFIDWLSAGGAPAFLLYIALFFTALVMLWRSRELSRAERIALTAALTGYAIHNLFVFDNLYSYIYFFAILALIDSQVALPMPRLERMKELAGDAAGVYALPLAGVAAIVLIGFVNYPGMRASAELITAITPQQDPATNLATFKDLLQHPGPAVQEVREQLVSSATAVAGANGVSDATKSAFIQLALQEMSAQVAEHPGDARTLLELSLAYRAAGDYQNSLATLKSAEEVSPSKQQIYVQQGATLWDGGDTKGAAAAFAKAYELGPQFSELATYAAAGHFITGDMAGGDAILEKTYGTTVVDSDILELTYFRIKDYPDLIKLWQLRAAAPDATAQQAYGLAAAYFVSGNQAAAIAQIKAAIAKYPDSAAMGQQLLAQIQGSGQ